MSQNVYSFGGVSVNGTFIPADDHNLPDGITEEALMTGIDLYPSWVGPRTQKPVPTFTTKAIKTALDLISFDGLAITTIVFYYLKRDVLGWDAGLTPHKSVTINDGIIVLNRLGWNGEDPATAEYSIYAIHDGTNAPYIYGDAVATPAPTVLTECFYGGPVKIGTLLEVNSWEYTTNFDVKHDVHSGNTHPKFASIRSGKPKATFTSNDTDIMDSVDASTSLIGATVAPILFLRKGAQTGLASGRVADATAEHIGVTINDAYVKAPSSSGGALQDATHTFEIIPRKSGATALITLDTTMAIA